MERPEATGVDPGELEMQPTSEEVVEFLMDLLSGDVIFQGEQSQAMRRKAQALLQRFVPEDAIK